MGQGGVGGWWCLQALRVGGPWAKPHALPEHAQWSWVGACTLSPLRPLVLWSLRPAPGIPASVSPAMSPADEMTVGKVYAALMIFDFYKQSKTSRDQTHPAPGLSQVPAPTSWEPPMARWTGLWGR